MTRPNRHCIISKRTILKCASPQEDTKEKKGKTQPKNNSNHRKIKDFNHLPLTEILEKLYDELQTKVGTPQQKKRNRQVLNEAQTVHQTQHTHIKDRNLAQKPCRQPLSSSSTAQMNYLSPACILDWPMLQKNNNKRKYCSKTQVRKITH